MGFNFNISFGQNSLPNYVERDSGGNWFYSILDNLTGTKRKFKSESAKLEMVLSNPALLKPLLVLSDTFSQVRIDKWQNNKEVEQNWLYSYQKQPNQWQSWTDLFWEHRFWLSLGTAYLYVENDVFYYLRPMGLDFTDRQVKSFSELTFSNTSYRQKRNDTFKYKNENGTTQILKFKNLYVFTDMSGGISGNWLKGNNRLDALYQIAKNSDLALQSKGTNLKFSQKFLVSGQHDAKDTSSKPMGDTEKDTIENNILNGRQVNATKSKVDLKHFVDNLAQLKLDEAYESDLIKACNLFDIPKEVIDILSKGSTYENQEKSIGKFINYCQMPKVRQMTDIYETILNEQDLRGSFSHLPFNAVFESEKKTNRKTDIEALKMSAEMGLDAKIVNDKLKEIWELN